MNVLQLLLLVSLVVVGACAREVVVGHSVPKANFAFAIERGAYVLRLAEDIKSDFRIPRHGAIGPVVVREWRSTLNEGFAFSLGKASEHYENDASKPRDVIVLEEVELSFSADVPSDAKVMHASLDIQSVVAHGNAAPHIASPPRQASYARIEFKATHLKGEQVAQTIRFVVYSAAPISSSTSPSQAVTSAVESMFEAIASEFLRIT
tara:strand:+ start:4159 stop:4779 length:621 start_codon:yes stop_codon:yes gene_type:complete